MSPVAGADPSTSYLDVIPEARGNTLLHFLTRFQFVSLCTLCMNSVTDGHFIVACNIRF